MSVTVSALQSELLVERYDGLTPETGSTLKWRFASTHHITTIVAVPRTREHCPSFHLLVALAPRASVATLIIERCVEAHMYWLCCEPFESVRD